MTTTVTVVLPTWMATDIYCKAREQNESGGVVLAGAAVGEAGLRLLGRELCWVPDDAYDRRIPEAMTIRSSGYVDALARAERRGDVPIWIHTHPGDRADPRQSEHDEIVNQELNRTFRLRSGADVYASLVFAPADLGCRFTGLAWTGDYPERIEQISFIGNRLTVTSAFDGPDEGRLPAHLDRQVRAFGGEVQRVLRRLRVGVVGCGGTGSSTAEQLARLGIGTLLLVDPKRLSPSNPTRVYGSTPEDVGRPKVIVLSEHLRRIAPSTEIHTIEGSVTDEKVARRLTSCDILFGCTDDNAGRLVLSRFPTYYLTPVIDVGVLLSSRNGVLSGIDGRVTVLTPGSACLVCRDRIDLARAGAEQLPLEELASRRAEGYAPELEGVEPAVVPYTSAVASFAVAELLERLIGYGPDPEPSEMLLRFHDREISTNDAVPRTRHYCDPKQGLIGAGDRDPFLGQLWHE